MKKFFWASTILAFLFPLSFALADTHVGGDVEINVHSTILHGEDLDEHEASSSEHASTTPWMNGEKKGLIKHFGTTTPPGISGNHEKIDEHASSTHGKSGLHIGLPAFLQWLFGLPATTTIGQLRADIEASTTASTSSGQAASTTSSAQGLGFWAHLFGFFHFGGK